MRIAATLMTLTALVLPMPTWGGDSLPEPTSSRVILHGVDCSIDAGIVCNEDRPVFDEAIADVPSASGVVIESGVLAGHSNELSRALPKATADAVRDYFIGNGIAPEQVGIEGCGETAVLDDGALPIGLQLSSSCN